jgi:hypothetical protein
MAAKGMVVVPFFLTMAILFELGGGLSVLLGFKARLGAWALPSDSPDAPAAAGLRHSRSPETVFGRA